MKKTDSVMREFKELLHNTSVSDSDLLDFFYDSLAEARREWDSKAEKAREFAVLPDPNPYGKWVSVKNHNRVVNQAFDLLTGDNPENECKVCHRTSDVVDMSKCPFCEHDQELIREGRAMSDFDTRRGI